MPSAPSRARPDLRCGGLLNFDKPQGATSFSVVQAVRRALGERRVGHCGTLDPMASGVLLILFGRATSQSQSLMAGEKVYRGRVLAGVRTDTGDVTGKVLEESPVPPLDAGRVRAALDGLTGSLSQVPPLYSAVKLRGRKLYEYARRGIAVTPQPRPVTVFSWELLGLGPESFQFRLRCSSGTYVRSLAEEAGKALGLPATLAELVRERSGEHRLEDSLSWQEFRSLDREALLARARPVPGP